MTSSEIVDTNIALEVMEEIILSDGVSIEKNSIRCFQNALACDPISSFGGVIAVNTIITKSLAYEINKIFFDIVISRGFIKDALKIELEKLDFSW